MGVYRLSELKQIATLNAYSYMYLYIRATFTKYNLFDILRNNRLQFTYVNFGCALKLILIIREIYYSDKIYLFIYLDKINSKLIGQLELSEFK